MKIVVTKDDGTEHVFQDVHDAYLTVRQSHPVGDDEKLMWSIECRSYSWGNNLRELVKELMQSTVEIHSLLDKKEK